MSRYNETSWSTIGLIFCIAISWFLPVGISTAREVKQEYDLPIYISQKVTISGYSSYTITGEIKNRTNEDVKVDYLEIALSGRDGDTVYHIDERLKRYDFIVPANSTYTIRFDDVVYTQLGSTVAHGELTNANISACIIDGKSVELKKKDGDYFVAQGGNSSGYIYAIILGSLGLIGSVAIIIYKVKDKFF